MYGKQWGAVPGAAGLWTAAELGTSVTAVVAAMTVLLLAALVGLRHRRVRRAERS